MADQDPAPQAQLNVSPERPAERPAAPALQANPSLVTDQVCASGNPDKVAHFRQVDGD